MLVEEYVISVLSALKLVKMNTSSLAFISILLVAAVLAVQELKPTKPRPRSDPEDDFGEDVESSIEYHTQLSSREIEREGLDFWHQISRQYEEYCDDRMSFVVEFLIVVAIILFAIFAYAVYSNSTSGRKKRSIASDDYDVDQLDIIDNGKVFSFLLHTTCNWLKFSTVLVR